MTLKKYDINARNKTIAFSIILTIIGGMQAFQNFKERDLRVKIANLKIEQNSKVKELNSLKKYVSANKEKLKKLNGYESNFNLLKANLQKKFDNDLIDKTSQRFSYYHYSVKVDGIDFHDKCINRVKVKTTLYPNLPMFQTEGGKKIVSVMYRSYLELRNKNRKIHPSILKTEIASPDYSKVDFIYELKKVR